MKLDFDGNGKPFASPTGMAEEFRKVEKLAEVAASLSGENKPQKHDAAKLRYELIPVEFLAATARGLTYGANKYAAGNWAQGKGLEHSRLFGAMQRHLLAYWSGEDVDAESGNCHLDHAACMLAFLIAGRDRGLGLDDREAIGVAPKPKR